MQLLSAGLNNHPFGNIAFFSGCPNKINACRKVIKFCTDHRIRFVFEVLCERIFRFFGRSCSGMFGTGSWFDLCMVGVDMDFFLMWIRVSVTEVSIDIEYERWFFNIDENLIFKKNICFYRVHVQRIFLCKII